MRYGAFGLVEVLGSSNAVRVIDQMLKTSEVTFRTWHSKCGGHTTVFLSGDVAAAVISNPSEETTRIVEEDAAKHNFN